MSKNLIKSSPFTGDDGFFQQTRITDGGNLLKSGYHKYIKRTGSPGDYHYWYKSPKGTVYATPKSPDKALVSAKEIHEIRSRHFLAKYPTVEQYAKDPSKGSVMSSDGKPTDSQRRFHDEVKRDVADFDAVEKADKDITGSDLHLHINKHSEAKNPIHHFVNSKTGNHLVGTVDKAKENYADISEFDKNGEFISSSNRLNRVDKKAQKWVPYDHKNLKNDLGSHIETEYTHPDLKDKKNWHEVEAKSSKSMSGIDDMQKEIREKHREETGMYPAGGGYFPEEHEGVFTVETKNGMLDVEIMDSTHLRTKPTSSANWGTPLHFNQARDMIPEVMDTLQEKGAIEANFFKTPEGEELKDYIDKKKSGREQMKKTGAAEPNIFEKRKTEIAKQTLKMNPAMAGVMGGPSIAEAKKTLGIKKSAEGIMDEKPMMKSSPFLDEGDMFFQTARITDEGHLLFLKAFPTGTIHTYKGKQYQKTTEGWVHVKKGPSGKLAPVAGGKKLEEPDVKRLHNHLHVVTHGGNKIVYSYGTPVAATVNGKEYRTEKKWSVTTSKHLGQAGYAGADRKPQEFFDKLHDKIGKSGFGVNAQAGGHGTENRRSHVEVEGKGEIKTPSQQKGENKKEKVEKAAVGKNIITEGGQFLVDNFPDSTAEDFQKDSEKFDKLSEEKGASEDNKQHFRKLSLRYKQAAEIKSGKVAGEIKAAEEPKKEAKEDWVGKIIDYENGDMPDEEVVKLFQHLVDTGEAWTIQGHYGRTASALIDAGLVKRKGGEEKKEQMKASPRRELDKGGETATTGIRG